MHMLDSPLIWTLPLRHCFQTCSAGSGRGEEINLCLLIKLHVLSFVVYHPFWSGRRWFSCPVPGEHFPAVLFGCNPFSGIVLFYPHRLSERVCPSVCGSGRSFPSSLAVCRISLVLCCLALLGIVLLFDWEEYGLRVCGRNSFSNS